MRKRIGIDLHVVDGMFQGSRTHVLELFKEVIALCPDLEFFLFLQEVDRLRRYAPEYSASHVSLVYMPLRGSVRRLGWQLPALQVRYRLDLLHMQYVLPLPSFSPCMVTIHDVLFETHPEYFKRRFRWRSKLTARVAAAQAVHLFSVSEYSKRAITQCYGVAPDKVSVIANAADTRRFYPGLEGAEIVLRRGLRSNGYILSVGRLEPRKNHIALIKAHARLGPDAPPLVIVGQHDFGFQGAARAIADSRHADRIHVLQDVGDNELPAFYRHAKVFVYPAFAEGFGMPPLEALASGTPVISSAAAAIPEVIGQAGILIDPHDEQDLETALNRVLVDDALALSLRRLGVERAMQFTWRQAAEVVRKRYLEYFASGDGVSLADSMGRIVP